MTKEYIYYNRNELKGNLNDYNFTNWEISSYHVYTILYSILHLGAIAFFSYFFNFVASNYSSTCIGSAPLFLILTQVFELLCNSVRKFSVYSIF